MHTNEKESLMNHNHYILDKGKDFTPERFKQHLDGFVKAERELAEAGIIKDGDSNGGKFLTQAEADQLVEAYTQHWNSINTVKGDSSTTELEEKKELGKKRLTKEDKIEFVKYNHQFNTVISEGYKKDEEGNVVKSGGKLESETYLKKNAHFTIDPSWPLNKRISAVKDAMRGGFSNRAQVRQMEGSPLANLAEIQRQNDEVKIDQINKSPPSTPIVPPQDLPPQNTNKGL